MLRACRCHLAASLAHLQSCATLDVPRAPTRARPQAVELAAGAVPRQPLDRVHAARPCSAGAGGLHLVRACWPCCLLLLFLLLLFIIIIIAIIISTTLPLCLVG